MLCSSTLTRQSPRTRLSSRLRMPIRTVGCRAHAVLFASIEGVQGVPCASRLSGGLGLMGTTDDLTQALQGFSASGKKKPVKGWEWKPFVSTFEGYLLAYDQTLSQTGWVQ